MTIRRKPRLDRATAEHLLRGNPAGSDLDGQRLAALLAAASGPPRQHELAGEQAALAAFRRARAHPVGVPRRRPLRTALAKFLTVKLFAGVAAVTAMGGVAFAASTGALPGPVQDAAHGVFGAPAASSGAAPGPAASPRPSPSRRPAAPADVPSVAPSPSPSVVGLCRAYRARVRTAGGKALDHPAFKALIAAAGKKADVPAYCDTVLAARNRPTGPPTPVPAATRKHQPPPRTNAPHPPQDPSGS